MPKVYCSHCKELVSPGTRTAHLTGGGWQHVKIEAAKKNLKNLTSRVLRPLRKRKRGEESDIDYDGQSDGASTATGPAEQPPQFNAMDIDVPNEHEPPSPAGSDEADSLAAPTVIKHDPNPLRSMRPRFARCDTIEDEDDPEYIRAPSPFVVDDSEDEDVIEPELEGELLTRVELSAAELLEEIFEAENATRGLRLTKDAMDAICAHNFKVDTDQGSRDYEKMKRAFPQLNDLPSLAQLQAQIAFISGIKPVKYDCCVRSCCCFVGPYAALDNCPYCSEARRDTRRRARAVFEYIPIIPRLQALFSDKKSCEELLYRAKFETGKDSTEEVIDTARYNHCRRCHKRDTISDVFDGLSYRRLCKCHVRVDGEVFSHRYFDQPFDLAMGLSADGVCPFKNRKATCWPLIGVLYNLNPQLRFLLDRVLCFGVIPGPHEPKDIDSFLIPLRDEFWRLARGIPTYNALAGEKFLMRAFLIRVFGDMPAVAKLMGMKGPNATFPCRACTIQGISNPDPDAPRTLYVPLHRENVDGESYDPLKLPLRTHDKFIEQAVEVDLAPTQAEAKRRAQRTGINGLPILATLSSLRFPDSFGHDLMHLIPENLVKNLLGLWTGDFKGLDEGVGNYELSETHIYAIGDECVLAGSSTPAVFGARVPNLATQRHYYTAESYTLFTTLLAPVLLYGRFPQKKYYDHFLKLVSFFDDSSALSLNRDYVDSELRTAVVQWVQTYERYYYQHDPSRLSTCPLTIHALLHIPDDILNGGPMCCYWNYITERWVGFLVRSSASRKNPYSSFARRIREIAQNSAIKVRFNLRKELDLSDSRAEDSTGVSVRGYPNIRVLKPHAQAAPTPQLRKLLQDYILRTFRLDGANPAGFVPETISHWGKISFHLSGGDKIDASEMVQYSEQNSSRDATFIKYSRQVDRNERSHQREVEWYSKVEYGQLLRVVQFHSPLPFIWENNRVTQDAQTLLLAVVRSVHLDKSRTQQARRPYYKDGNFGAIHIINVDEISCLVARIPDHGTGPRRWALCERHDAMGTADNE